MYFDYVLKNSARESSKGSSIKKIPPFEIFKQLLLSLPPLAEQKRIVAKIEEIYWNNTCYVFWKSAYQGIYPFLSPCRSSFI